MRVELVAVGSVRTSSIPVPATSGSEVLTRAALSTSGGAKSDFLSVTECRREAIRLAHEGRFSDLPTLWPEHDPKLPVQSNQNPQHQNEHNFRNAYASKLGRAGGGLGGFPVRGAGKGQKPPKWASLT
jgi:hypothetical protein